MAVGQVLVDFRRLFHLGYVVKNMDRAVKIWQRSGAVLVVPPKIDPIQNVSCSLLAWEKAAAIELVAPLPDGPNPVATRLNKGGGLDHICLFSDDIDADAERFMNKRAICVVQKCYGAVFDRQLMFFQTPEGLTVELMERHPSGEIADDPLRYFHT